MIKITFNGIELEIDLMDADTLEKFEDLLKRTSDDIAEKTQYEGLRGSEQMRLQCRHVNRFFDDLFGEGTAEKVFGTKYNLMEHMEAFGQAASMVNQMSDEVRAVKDKYNPKRVQNRAERRTKARKNRNNQIAAYHK